MTPETALLEKVRPFFDDAQAQLESTPHFGLLADLLELEAGPSRAEYVLRHCMFLRRVKEAVAGIGLGRSDFFPKKSDARDRDDWAKVQKFTGLEICQAWAILLNAGHLWATFATERGLLFELDRDLPYREEFVSTATDFDKTSGNTMRGVFEDALDKVHLHKFHYLLAIWRLRDNGLSKLAPQQRQIARILIKAFLLTPTESLKRLVFTFRKTRQLVYLSIHNGLKNAKYQVNEIEDSDLPALFPADMLVAGDWVARTRWDVFDAIDRHDAAELFGSNQAAAHVLAHVESFKNWWKALKKRETPLGQMLDQLYCKPADWPFRELANYRHFVSLKVPSSVDWLSEVRLWLRDSSQADPWGNANFLVTANPQETTLRIDIYNRDEGISTLSLEHAVHQLSRAFGAVHDRGAHQELEMSCAQLIARTFESTLLPGYSLRIRPLNASNGQVRYACLGNTYELVRGIVKKFLPTCKDPNRAIELRQTITIADELGHWRCPAMMMLGIVEVVRAQEYGFDTIAEIDGLVGIFLNGRILWLVVETKKEGSQDGEKQLRAHLGGALKDSIPEVCSKRYRGQEAWYFILESPERVFSASVS